MNYGTCECELIDKRIVLSENKSKVTFLNINNKRIKKIIIDGCVITSGIRCDYLLVDNNRYLFIELKGSDVYHAISQIHQTIRTLKIKSSEKEGLVVTHRCPISSTEIQVLKKKMRKIGCKLDVICSNKEIEI